MKKITEIALKEADIYAQAGLDGFIIENMHDLPYVVGDSIGPEITASMTAISTVVKSKFPSVPVGIQVLKAGNKQALAVAQASGCDFIRAECFTFSHISDAGWINASAGDLLRYRKLIKAEGISIFTDVKKKHSSHAVTDDMSVVEAAEAAEFFQTDGVIVTGNKTGQAANIQELNDLCSHANTPILVGSGVTIDNVSDFMQANGFIIGSHFKYGGIWSNDIDQSQVISFIHKLRELKR